MDLGGNEQGGSFVDHALGSGDGRRGAVVGAAAVEAPVVGWALRAAETFPVGEAFPPLNLRSSGEGAGGKEVLEAGGESLAKVGADAVGEGEEFRDQNSGAVLVEEVQVAGTIGGPVDASARPVTFDADPDGLRHRRPAHCGGDVPAQLYGVGETDGDWIAR
ncbi:hypothetical protein ACFYO5_35615 [Streptomyces sp. NPDC006259]|uniref:hypothetical protein n=1 Tax=Streptomyces sp. NPDC006259 TaxID=3364740 RepID=UPI0036829F1D